MSRRFAAIVFASALAVFTVTAYPTINWWDSSNYSTAAYTLGIPSPPGSLLLTLIGWPVSHLPLGSSPAHALNVFAGVLAATATTLVFAVALSYSRVAFASQLASRTDSQTDSYIDSHTDSHTAARGGDTAAIESYAALIGAALGALTFAFQSTTWEYATQFTPYVFTIVFTGAILWTLLKWWSKADTPQSMRWIFILTLLFGLDFSVHRTNAMLIPAACAWLLIRRVNLLWNWRAWMAAIAGIACGLVVQLLVIPIAIVSRSPVNFSTPNTFARFWDFVSLKQFGGGFLFQLYPRHSPLLSNQAADIVRTLRANMFDVHGSFGVLGALPGVIAIVGIVALWRRSARLGFATTVLLILHAATTVAYFNIPLQFFRTFDRHYLPVCLSIATVGAFGMSELARMIATWSYSRANSPAPAHTPAHAQTLPNALSNALPKTLRKSQSRANLVVATMVLAIVPATQLVANWKSRDASNRFYVHDYAANVLGGLPKNAIYFTVGDNDTYPVLYLQSVEHVRTDVTLVNLSVLNMTQFPEQLRALDPTFPISISTTARAKLLKTKWTDTLTVLPVNGAREELGVSASEAMLPSLALPTKPARDTKFIEADVSLVDIVRTNAWKRPLTFALSGGSDVMAWLTPYGRAEGMYWRVVPVLNPLPNANAIRASMLDSAQYRGYADPSVILDDFAMRFGNLYYTGIAELGRAPKDELSLAECQRVMTKFQQLVPANRLKSEAMGSPASLTCAQSPP